MPQGKHDHESLVREVRHDLPSDELLSGLSDLFRIFGDATRVKILYSLFEADLCVCAITELLNASQSAVSHQLKILKDSNLVTCRRDGKQMIYSLADDHVRDIVEKGFEHLTEKGEN